MTDYESIEVEGTDLEPCDVRALIEYLTVLDDVGRVAGAPEMYLVVSQSGSEFLVDGRDGSCTWISPPVTSRGGNVHPPITATPVNTGLTSSKSWLA